MPAQTVGTLKARAAARPGAGRNRTDRGGGAVSDVPDNVDLRWIARALVGLRQDVRDMRRELDGFRSDVRAAREDTNVAIMHTIRIERTLDEIRDNLADLYGRSRGLSERVDRIEGEG